MKTFQSRRGAMFATAAMLASAGVPAVAAAADLQQPEQLQEVIVTAQKRTENLQKLSTAAAAATGDQLVRAGISSTTGLSQLSPAIKLTAIRGQTQIYVRGIGSSLTSSNADPAIAVNVNGAYVPSEMTTGAFFDLDRVEILPGPQGTLYGRNAAGGAINIISKEPGGVFGGEGYVELGRFDTVNLFSAINLPISDNFAVRIAAVSLRHDGYLSGTNGSKLWEQDSTSARITALFKPSDRTKILGSVSFSKDAGVPNVVQDNPPARGDYWSIPIDSNALGLKTDYETVIATAQIDQQLSDTIDLTYVGGYSRFDGQQKSLIFSFGLNRPGFAGGHLV